MAIRGALLDVDGTLVLSNDGQAQAWVEAFAAYGYDAPYDKVRPMVGMGGDKIIPYFAPGLTDKEGVGKSIADKRKEPERTTKDDAGESKPAPDIVSVALKKIGLPPNEVVMIGDAPYDIESAEKIGVGTIAVRCGGFSDEDLKGALAIYDDPADLLAHYDESPLAGTR